MASASANSPSSAAQHRLARLTVNQRQLLAHFPPRVHCGNKKILLDLALPNAHESVHPDLQLTFARYDAMPLPSTVPPIDVEQLATGTRLGSLLVLPRAGVFEYPTYRAAERAEEASEFHVNFADRHLFGYYAGNLFAQDEIMVAEVPVCMSVRSLLLARSGRAMVVDDGADERGKWVQEVLGALSEEERDELLPITTTQKATPCLVMGAERRVAVDTSQGLYGNAFARVSEARVRAATRVQEPPVVANILAMEAPTGGHGQYTRRQLERILTTAYTSFAAAKNEAGGACCIATGHWGCGAYGGNREVMAMLQVLAALLAGVDEIVYYTFNEVQAKPVQSALKRLPALLVSTDGQAVSLDNVLGQIEKMGFRWGMSDGN